MAFRGQATAFVCDDAAVQIAKQLIVKDQGAAIAGMPLLHQLFAIMPLQHSEDAEDQVLAVAQMERLTALSRETHLEGFLAECCEFARKHQKLVSLFGRFPQRNKILKRQTTAEETAFMTAGGEEYQ